MRSRMKYVANLLVAIHNVATAEAMVLGMKAGLDPQAIFETIRTGAGNSRVFELRGPMMVAGPLRRRHHEGEGLAEGHGGDRRIRRKRSAARRRCSPRPKPIYDAAMNSGHAMQDTAAVCAVMEKMAGVKRSNRKRRT